MDMDFIKFITENCIIVIPCLYIIGMIFKSSTVVNDKYIPIILLIFGIIFCVFLSGLNIQSILQGILTTGTTVYTNQLLKQGNK